MSDVHLPAPHDPTLDDGPTFVDHLVCGRTDARLDADRLHGVSPDGAPILVRYDLDALGRTIDRDAMARRPPGLWRYRPLLPVRDPSTIVSLGEGETPLLSLPQPPGAAPLYVKDEGRLPTGSFKARGLALAVAMARHFGVRRVAMPSNGNAGAALAAYGVRGGLDVTVVCPRATPAVNRAEIALHGARLLEIDGLIDDGGRFVAAGERRGLWFNVSTLREPYRIEGKKTMGLELAQQLGWRLPDVILYPTGGGTGLIGMWKAFAELRALGWIEGDLPRMVAVQSTGCAPIVRAFEAGAETATRWENPAPTMAYGIRVPAALGDFLILRALRESDGFAIAVDEASIVESLAAAAAGGVLLCPEGAATYAAYRRARADGRIARDETAVLFNCASGHKYPLPVPQSDPFDAHDAHVHDALLDAIEASR
ncbi:MAG: threonine synthase [Acidobacteriota bacterium]